MSAHPSWCSPARCTALDQGGAHRGQPVVVEGILLSLYADAAAPGIAKVEIRAGTGVLAAYTAYAVGRTLVSLARRANGNAT